MISLGISIYPDKSILADDLNYIELAAKYQVTKVFTNLLGLGGKSRDEIKKEFTERIEYAHQYGMEVIVDVSPAVFEDLEITYDDLSFFDEIGADGIRMDEAFDGSKEAMMSHNKYGLKLEFNASGNTNQIKNIFAFKPNKKKLVASHNFFPQRYTGLGLEYFIENSKKVKENDIQLKAFISSNDENAFGPWDINEGLSTLEMHRDLPIDLQARHLIATELIDDILIANCYASEEEFKALTKIVDGKVNIRVDLEYELSEVEKKILHDDEHFVRGDISDYMRRSTMTRVKYADAKIKPQNTRDLRRGDIIIVNDDYTRYKGELHVVLQEMPNEGNKNVVGRVKEKELFLLDYLNSWDKFVLSE